MLNARRRAPLWGAIAIGALGCFYATVGVWFVLFNSQTYDEPAYYYSGYGYLARGDFAVNVHQPPLSKQLAALPIFVLERLHAIAPSAYVPLRESRGDAVRDFLYRSPLPFSTMLLMGRLPMLLLGLLTVGVVACWAFRLWGVEGAIFATALAVTEPTFLAHSGLVTPDIAVTFFSTLFFYLLWRYTSAPSWGRFWLVGLALGAALGSKFSALGALPAMLVLAVLDDSRAGWVLPWRATRGRVWRGEALLLLALWLGVAGATLVALYGGHGLPFLRQGVAGQLRHVAQGHPAFFWGRYSEAGWWYYFPAAFALKTPLPTLAAIAATVACLRCGAPFRRRPALFLFVPMVCLLALMAWGGVDIGVRYLLPVYPLLFVSAGRVATIRTRAPLLFPFLLAAGILCNVGGVLTVGPHFLASANTLAGGPVGLAGYLSDSNIDWGQDIGTLKRYMDGQGIRAVYLSYFGTANPSDYGIRRQYLPSNFRNDEQHELVQPDAGAVLAVSVTNLQGTYLADHDLYAWLRTRRPIARLGWSIYVYDLSGEPGLHCRLADLYAAAGEPGYAAHERRRCGGS